MADRQPMSERLLVNKEMETKIQILQGVVWSTIAKIARLKAEKEQIALDTALSL